ncbi:MAG: alpha-galactosidase, partial [Spirochaetaceae bacterium]|nr:alpha-galactosidase [Spirochaetaceae bacterium]
MNLKDIHREKTLFSTQDGCKLSIFHYSYSGETGALEADSGRRVIDSFSLEDICTAVVQSSSAGDGEPFPSEQLSFAELRRRECFVQLTGWQSWSAGWELAPGERFPSYIPVIPPLENYIYPPLVPSREKTRTGSFIMWLRFGTEYLGFASIGRDTAPVNYTFDPKSLSVVITIYSYGKKWKPGEQMAEIALFHARSPFELKGIMGELYGTAHGDRRAQRFAGLEFLSAEEERIIPAGWESWYSHYHNIDETLILRELYALNKNGNLLNQRYIQKGKPIIFQIDDGWQREVGDWEQERLRFPSGLEAVTAKIEGEGYIPGLWIAPFAVSRRAPIFSRKPEWLLRNTKGKPVKAGFNPPWGGDYFCLDLSRDDVIEHIDTVMERVINEWGFRYIKLDFLFAGMLPGAFTVPGGVWEWYIRAVQMLTARKTDRRGKPVAYLGCGLPLELSYRYLPLSRIGADTREHWERGELKLLRFAGRPSAYISMRDTIGRSF